METDQKGDMILAETGIVGFDRVLYGGLTAFSLNLIEGAAGTGKTTFGLQFALKGVQMGESVLYVTLAETKAELEAVARSHGWSLDSLNVLEAHSEEIATSAMFHPAELELEQLTARIRERVKETSAKRIIIDSLAEIRLMAESPFRFRREIVRLKQALAFCRCTLLLLEEETRDGSLRTFVDTAILLEQLTADYGPQRRRLLISKARGRRYLGGYHDFVLGADGMCVFPRLVAAAHKVRRTENVLSGVDSLDALLGGGVSDGASTLIVGPAGSGKSSLSMQFVFNAAKHGQSAAMYLFEERQEVAVNRAIGLKMDVQALIDSGQLRLQQLDPAEVSAGQFGHMVREDVETRSVRVLVIDSVNGYLHAMPSDRFLLAHLHEMLTFLGQQGVATFLIMGQSGVIGGTRTPADASYLMDNIILLRFFEAAGEVRKAISVVKKRSGSHETTIRELRFGPDGINIGETLHEFRGVLTGEPVFEGSPGQLLRTANGKRQDSAA